MSSDGGPQAADIIAYIGIPLSVLGVLPIIYTFINSLVTAFNIRRKLRSNAVTDGITRSSVLSGIIEVEFPRFSIAVPDRDDPDYWSLNPHPTRLKGGSWTIFNWNKLATGKKMYRLQFSADMQVPQAEVDFDELLGFLIDRGARPDPKGLRLLNMAGLWTPANTSLLLSADQTESVLRVTFPDDSDGILSLALQWRVGWDKLAGEVLPPHWMRLEDGRPPRFATEGEEASKDVEASKNNGAAESVEEKGSEDEKNKRSPSVEEKAAEKRQEAGTPAPRVTTQSPTAVSLHLSMRAGLPIIDNIQNSSQPSVHQPSQISSSSYIAHGSSSNWLAVLATALGTLQGAPIFTIHLPSAFVSLASRDVLPCGILVTCDILPESESPSWATTYDPMQDQHEYHQAFVRKGAAMRAETSMAPAARDAAKRAREAMEFQDFVEQSKRRRRRDQERRDRREREALESTRLSTDIAVQAVLKRLSKAEVEERKLISTGETASLVEPWNDLQAAAETVLFMMVTEEQLGKEVCAILEMWRVWTERGGMNKEDLYHVTSGSTWKSFCYAIIAMGLLKAEGQKKESSLALDLQDCVRTWKRVRLG